MARQRSLPASSRDQRLGRVAANHVATEQDRRRIAVPFISKEQIERGTGMPQPQLIRIDAVPMRPLPLLKQIVDRRPGRARALTRPGAPGLAIPPPFGMRYQLKSFDDLGGFLHST